jgi:predicted TPR repeat methyltransferase
MLSTVSTPAQTSSSMPNGSSGVDQAAAAAPAGELETGYTLQATGRYAHSADHLRQAAAASGWQLVLLQEAVTMRYNAGQPILGNLCVLQRCQ